MNRIFKKHEKMVVSLNLPADIAPFLNGYTLFKLVRNYPAPTNVYRAIREGHPNFFLKVGKRLFEEQERLLWLKNTQLTPKVVAYSTLENQEFLLLTEIAGLPADDDKWITNINSLIEIVAEGVRTIQSLPEVDCPFDASAEILMEKAEKVVRLELLEQSDLSEVYRHRTINDLFNDLKNLFPCNDNYVFTHGDLCLPNILIQQRASFGFVDLGLAGLGDPHRDLALVARSIRRNFGEKWLQMFFDAYGQEVDEQKMEFYSLLDQFTMERNYTFL